MNTSGDEMHEQIALALHDAHTDGAGDYGPPGDAYRDLAAAVLPLIEQAVKRGQAEAWDEGQEAGWNNAREESEAHGGVCDMWKPHVWLEPNPYRYQIEQEIPDEQ